MYKKVNIRSIYFEDKKVEDIIEELQDIQKVYGDTFSDLEVVEDYEPYCDTKTTFIVGKRLETEKEKKQREKEEENQRKTNEAYEKAQYERLKAKFGK